MEATAVAHQQRFSVVGVIRIGGVKDVADLHGPGGRGGFCHAVDRDPPAPRVVVTDVRQIDARSRRARSDRHRFPVLDFRTRQRQAAGHAAVAVECEEHRIAGVVMRPEPSGRSAAGGQPAAFGQFRHAHQRTGRLALQRRLLLRRRHHRRGERRDCGERTPDGEASRTVREQQAHTISRAAHAGAPDLNPGRTAGQVSLTRSAAIQERSSRGRAQPAALHSASLRFIPPRESIRAKTVPRGDCLARGMLHRLRWLARRALSLRNSKPPPTHGP